MQPKKKNKRGVFLLSSSFFSHPNSLHCKGTGPWPNLLQCLVPKPGAIVAFAATFALFFCLIFFLLNGIANQKVLPSGKSLNRANKSYLVSRMKYHGCLWANRAHDGTWYFFDKRGRRCRLW